MAYKNKSITIVMKPRLNTSNGLLTVTIPRIYHNLIKVNVPYSITFIPILPDEEEPKKKGDLNG